MQEFNYLFKNFGNAESIQIVSNKLDIELPGDYQADRLQD